MSFRILFFSFTLLFCLGLAQRGFSQTDLKTANRLYDEMAFAEATEMYQKLLDKKEPTLEIVQRIAHGYRFMNNSKQAEFWYAQVLAFPSAASINIFYYAEAARRNGNYTKARQLYQQYGNQVKTDAALAQKMIAACDDALKWSQNPKAIELTPESFNSANSDFSPVFYKNGIVYTSDREKAKGEETEIYRWNGKPFLQLYYLERDKSKKWGKPVAMPQVINDTYHNATATFTKDGNTIYFTRTNKERYKKHKVNTDPTSWTTPDSKNMMVSRLEIYSSEFKNGAWTKPKAFEFNKPRDYSVAHPALSSDGKVLYFASDMPGSLGETDLYFCQKQNDGKWSKPVNCGPAVNSAGKEAFPVLTPAGKLYYSSDGKSGMGGLDIFSAEGARDQWQNVTNLQAPLNSGGDDFGMIFETDGESGFLSSNRKSENGTDDIYSFKPYHVPCSLAGQTIEQATAKNSQQPPKPLPGVMVKLFQGNDTVGLTAYSDANGKFSFPILQGVKYTVKAIKEGYLTKSAEVTPDCKSVLDMVKFNMVMNQNVVNNSYIVENIYYDVDKSDIREDAALELNKLVSMLRDNPAIKIELSSHTDSRQSNGYNQMLSQLRAEAAVKYIISQGIEAKRITAKGYGESKLLNRCKDGVKCSEKEHQVNRRTEFKLIR